MDKYYYVNIDTEEDCANIVKNSVVAATYFFNKSSPYTLPVAVEKAEKECAELNKPPSELIYSMESGVFRLVQ